MSGFYCFERHSGPAPAVGQRGQGGPFSFSRYASKRFLISCKRNTPRSYAAENTDNDEWRRNQHD